MSAIASAGVSSAWPTTCTVIAPNHKMKLTLCACTSHAASVREERADACRDQGDGGSDDDGSEDAQHQWWRTLRRVGGVASVVPNESVAGTGDLHDHERDEEHPHEGVYRHERLNAKNGDALDEQQNEDRRAEGSRDARVSLDPSVALAGVQRVSRTGTHALWRRYSPDTTTPRHRARLLAPKDS